MKYLSLFISFVFALNTFAQDFTLADFYNYNPELERRIDEQFSYMNDTCVLDN